MAEDVGGEELVEDSVSEMALVRERRENASRTGKMVRLVYDRR